MSTRWRAEPVTTGYNVSDLGALRDAARTFDAPATRLAGEVEVLTDLGTDSVAGGLSTGDHDLDRLIEGKVDEIIKALAGEGERLQQISKNLTTNVQNYESTDGQAARDIDAIHW
jgi:hypothetical protein